MANVMRKMIRIVGKTLLGILIIFIMAIAVLITVSVIRNKVQEAKNEEYRGNYVREIKAYLEEKYGIKRKNFRVNPHFFYYSDALIPGSRNHSPYMFEVWDQEAGDGYVFNVWIDTVSQKDDQIKEITDNYCWKFFNSKIKAWFEHELADVMPQEYKFASCLDLRQGFDKSVRPDSPLEYYFETEDHKIQLLFFLIIPPDNMNQGNEITEERVEKAVNSFYKNYPNSRIVFYVVQTQNVIDYRSIYVRELENRWFYLRKESKSIWDIEGIEDKIRIEVGTLN